MVLSREPNGGFNVEWAGLFGADRHYQFNHPRESADKIVRAERMPLKSASGESVVWADVGNGQIQIELSESPVYLWIKP